MSQIYSKYICSPEALDGQQKVSLIRTIGVMLKLLSVNCYFYFTL